MIRIYTKGGHVIDAQDDDGGALTFEQAYALAFLEDRVIGISLDEETDIAEVTLDPAAIRGFVRVDDLAPGEEQAVLHEAVSSLEDELDQALSTQPSLEEETIIQQFAKIALYRTLVLAGEPIPNDLKDEVEQFFGGINPWSGPQPRWNGFNAVERERIKDGLELLSAYIDLSIHDSNDALLAVTDRIDSELEDDEDIATLTQIDIDGQLQELRNA